MNDRPPHPEAIPVLVSFALSQEAAGLLDRMQDVEDLRCARFREFRGSLHGQPVLVVLTGVGSEQAAQAADDILQLYRPDWWIGTGFAGGLDASLEPFDCVMATRIIDAATDSRLETGLAPQDDANTNGARFGHFVTVRQVASTPKQKHALAGPGIVACDMESYALASRCRDHHVRYIGVRVISDTIDEKLPPELHSITRQTTWPSQLGAVAGAMFRRPSVAKDLWHLKERGLLASDRLADYLEGVLKQLPASRKSLDDDF